MTLEKTTALASARRPARRAASASTRSVTAGWRRSAPDSPIVTGTTSQLAPASRTSEANASSERRSPGVVPSDTTATSTGGATRRQVNLGAWLSR